MTEPHSASVLLEHAPSSPGTDAQRLRRSTRVFGPLAPYLVDPAVTDLFVNGHEQLWVDRGGGAVREAGWSCPGEDALRAFAVRLVAHGGRHIDEASPCVDVEVEGVRVHVVLPPIAAGGTTISVRVPGSDRPDLDALARRGVFGTGSSAVAARRFVEQAVGDRVNVLVTGAGGSGKTTFLAALLAGADPRDRLVVIEDVTELRVAHPHVVALEARQPNLEGAGGIGLAELVRQALRMRPDRLVLGECRGAEIRELLSALNTGHDGGAGTLHANAIADVPARLEALGALAGLDASAIARQAVSAIGLVVHLRRTDRGREIEGFGRLALDARDRLVVREVALAPAATASRPVQPRRPPAPSKPTPTPAGPSPSRPEATTR
ncbi:TadA family conjugal transfer-associated ATPase [Herbiconiux sp. P18]|uniref:TadA family conjugal transfer-associated ATPase n=1 Tax=Herbiconiux liangxiaofengii TaxID=3342795 RepID=UPI0035BA8E29